MDDEPHDLIGAYAVGALDADERLAFEAHLSACASCQHELAVLGDALAGLADDYETAPPPALRAAVLDAVAKSAAPSAPTAARPLESTESPTSAGLLEGAASTPGVDAEPTPEPRRAIEETADAGTGTSDGAPAAPVTPLRPPSARPRWQFLVAAVIALIAVIGISVWQPWVQRTVTAADVLAAPDAVRATKTIDGDASVTLVRSNRLGKAVLITRNMPPAPTGKAHQAWLLQPGGAMVSGGMMPASADVTMLLAGDARDTVGAGISVEPPGGSARPNLDGAIVVEL